MENTNNKVGIGVFERYLTVWVAICIVVGIAIGHFIPAVPTNLDRLTFAEISLPIAVLIWLMIYPMMLKVDFTSIVDVTKNGRGLVLTLVVNWLIKPFTMFAIAWFFLNIAFANLIEANLANEYLAGAILLGAAPCTAMVFVWSHLTKGNPSYTVVQVAINNLVLLLLFTPIVGLLLGVGNIPVPYNTLLLSVVLFVVIPLMAGIVSRVLIIKYKGFEYFSEVFVKKFRHVTVVGLLLTLIIIFTFQATTIIENPFHILLLAIPLTIQTFFIFSIAYFAAKAWRLTHDVAAPAAMIGASNFFELAVAVAIALYGVHSAAALTTVVGVLVEVPVMLTLVAIANKTRHWFKVTA